MCMCQVNQTLDLSGVVNTLARAVVSSGGITGGGSGSGISGISGVATSALSILGPLLSYNGPMPIPDFNTYITLNRFFRGAIGLANSTAILTQLDRLGQVDSRF